MRGDDPPGEGIADWSPRERIYVLDPREEWSEGLRFDAVAGESGLHGALQAEARGQWSTEYRRWICHVGHPQKIDNFFKLLAPNQRRGKPAIPGLVILDEAHVYQSTQKIQPGLKRMAFMGGNDDQSIVIVSQFWTQLHRHIRSNIDVLVSFRGLHSDTIRELERRFDDRAGAVHDLSGHEFTILGEHRAIPWNEKARRLDSYVDPSQEA